MTNNEILVELLNKIEKSKTKRCDDHTPYHGPCLTCGEYDNDIVYPSAENIIEIIKKMME